ncbi:MAG: hypothetical protein KKD18_01925 [Nanoarchaeota archaeon]|nr:hypothetical protein [Nanoarchaeota archaeon]
MRMWAFIVFVVGMFVMFVLFNLPARVVADEGELEGMVLNTRVFVSGVVAEERVLYEGTKLLKLDGGVEVVAESIENFEGKNVEIWGMVSDYEGKKQVVAEKVLF